MANSSLPPERMGFDPSNITRPAPSLLLYFLTVSVFTGPFFPLTFLPLFFKYQTLRYQFDDQGISMKWGLIFRREIYLTYRRIQDIHLTTNLVAALVRSRHGRNSDCFRQHRAGNEYRRNRGICRVARYLYSQMRGARGLDDSTTEETTPSDLPRPSDEALSLLCEIRDLLQSQVENSEAKP